jgi:hypothetical protein
VQRAPCLTRRISYLFNLFQPEYRRPSKNKLVPSADGTAKNKQTAKKGAFIMNGVKPMKVYVASSWKNHLQPAIVHIIRIAGHEVYDFRNPAPGNTGFKWQSIDPDWKPGDKQNAEQYKILLASPVAESGYKLDITALKECDLCVLVMPAGRSACWEFGFAMGQGKKGIVVWFGEEEPDLMFREAKIIGNMTELFDYFGQ